MTTSVPGAYTSGSPSPPGGGITNGAATFAGGTNDPGAAGGTKEVCTRAPVKMGGTANGGMAGTDCVPEGLIGGGAHETAAAVGIACGGAQDTPDPCRGGGTHELAATTADTLPVRGVACLPLPMCACTIRGVPPTGIASPVNDLERDMSRDDAVGHFGRDCAETA
jgi:hypothetical protein